MRIELVNNIQVLFADDGKQLFDEESGAYFTEAYLPASMTLEKCEKRYKEVEIEEPGDDNQ